MSRILCFIVLLLLILQESLAQRTGCAHSSFENQRNVVHEDSPIDLHHVHIDLSANNQSTYIAGSTSLLATVLDASINNITLELTSELSVSAVSIDDTNIGFLHQEDLLIIETPSSLHEGQIITIRVSYSGSPNPGTQGILSGINNESSPTWGNRITWTLSEPFNAKKWWPSTQKLGDKIDSACIFITTDQHLRVGSNGLLTRAVPLQNSRVRYEWKTTYPIAYYLIAFTVGEYVERISWSKPDVLNGDSILIQDYIYDNPGTLPQFESELLLVPDMMELFSNTFGPYPFREEKYGHVMAPFSGGMEHQTMSSMGFFTFGLNAHELGHQWFGNYVTCGTWNDIWINEGFARFCEYYATEQLLSEQNARENIKDDMLTVTGTPSGSIYVPEGEITEDRIFNFRLTYAKGGLILNMLRHLVDNDGLFFDAIRTYLERYKNQTATGEDFRKVLEEVTEMDFQSFFEEWYYGGGYPIFDIAWQKIQGDSIRISVNQETTDNISLFTTPLKFRIKYTSGQIKIVTLSQTQNEQVFNVYAGGTVKSVVFDPEEWLIKKVNSFIQLDDLGNPILGNPSDNQKKIYPNPTDGIIYLDQIENLDRLGLFDISGQSIPISESSLSDSQIDLTEHPAGIYYLQVQTFTKTKTYRIIKN